MSEAAKFVLGAVLALALVASLAWVWLDAKRRGRSPLVVAVLCLLTWPIGLLLWRTVRPPPPIAGSSS